MFGVMELTFVREGGSINGDEDFFSVARTIPLVAVHMISLELMNTWSFRRHTFDT